MQTDSITEMATKAGVPVTVSGLTAFGVSLPEIVQVLTGLYVFLMAVDKLYIMIIRYRENRLKELHEIKGENGTKE